MLISLVKDFRKKKTPPNVIVKFSKKAILYFDVVITFVVLVKVFICPNFLARTFKIAAKAGNK